MRFQAERPFLVPALYRVISLTVLGVALAFSLAGCDGTGTGGNNDDNPSPSSDPVGGFSSQPAPVVIDGQDDDWSNLTSLYDDTGDGGEGIAIEKLWVAHTDQHLFLRLIVDRQIDLLENNDLTLHLDADNNPATGASSLGLGAELEWIFGQRTGRLRGQEISHDEI